MIGIQKELHPEFWEKDGTIRADVRKTLLQIAKDFIEFTKVKNLKLYDVIFTGSLANYTYHEKSDIDLHVVFDLSNFERHRDFIKEYLSAKKTIWNNNHDVTIHGFKVEIYPEDEMLQHDSTGDFSLIKNDWVKKPNVPEKIVVDKGLVKRKYQDNVDQILYFEDQADKKKVDFKKLIKDIEKYAVNLRDKRKAALKAHGELSTENLVYKMLRSNGYVEKLHNLKDLIYDKHMSIKETIAPSVRVYMMGERPNYRRWTAASDEEANTIANAAKAKNIDATVIPNAWKDASGTLLSVVEFPVSDYNAFHSIVKKLIKPVK